MIDWLVRTMAIRPLAALVAWLRPPLPRRGNVVLRLRLAGRLAETVPRALPFLPVNVSGLSDVVGLLYAAAREPRIVGVRVDVGPLEAGMARIQEVRRALHALREADKHVHVSLEAGGTKEYLVACAADTISMPPATSLDLVGLRSEVAYLGGVAASLGVHADFEAVGDYKAFAERFVRTGPTGAARENARALLHDVWDQLVQGVAAGRGLDSDRAADLLGRGPYGVDEAVELGLVDGAAYPDEVREQVKEVVGKHKTVKAKRYGARLRRVQRWRWRASRAPLVAVVTATGQIMAGTRSGRWRACSTPCARTRRSKRSCCGWTARADRPRPAT